MAQFEDSFSYPGDPRRPTVVIRRPSMRVMLQATAYYKPAKNKRFWARWAMTLGYWALTKWGEYYDVPSTVKYLEPVQSDSDVQTQILRQINSLLRDYEYDLDSLVILVGAHEWEQLMCYARIGLPEIDLCRDVSNGVNSIKKWRNLSAVIVPDMVGVLVIPKRILNNQL